jgi:hypothetical protein
MPAPRDPFQRSRAESLNSALARLGRFGYCATVAVIGGAQAMSRAGLIDVRRSPYPFGHFSCRRAFFYSHKAHPGPLRRHALSSTPASKTSVAVHKESGTDSFIYPGGILFARSSDIR